jgi:hypothetical protein
LVMSRTDVAQPKNARYCRRAQLPGKTIRIIC